MKHIANAKLIASVTSLAALGACMSSSGTGTMGGAGTAAPPPSATVGTTAAPVAPTNTGTPAAPGPVDTSAATKTPPTGAANSRVGTGTGVAGMGGGLVGKPSGAAAVPGNVITNIGSDARIVSALDVVNTDEIATAMLAREKATSPRVRMFAERLLTDHTRLQGVDRALAAHPEFISSDSADITREMRRSDNAALVRLRALPKGPGFDAAYIAGEIADHKHAIELANASVNQAQDPRVKELASSSIPALQEHLNMAMSIQQSMGPM
ncbi:MAG: DUF4142 domain-containing protein [Gemmatimonadaceae bacterium]